MLPISHADIPWATDSPPLTFRFDAMKRTDLRAVWDFS